ncbi:biopolymer transport protein ExbD/biopolymer transport protein TolR [Paucibacter oligotrophus]|uniref:Biopolymer transport protein ExbD/biopolymer transport protein TolR n=1 Tax=Roseateles oligotrophus TaxID=1769250 RepID=A0A840L3R9_9BURK|nr:biopolymer transporter ExbD [Roseateles oligotrophus]MBB4842850.1 biopolymer transport protein ExbD/biopolymer transport protein TolR [Roseateles oligotrophus]
MAFGRLERTEKPKPMGEINMTPLIDVMLVLLVIFMIAAPLMTSSLHLDLPKSEAARPSEAPQFIAIGLQPDGSLWLGEARLDKRQLQQRLMELGKARPELEVQLRADRSVPYGQVAELIGWCQSAGLSRIAFVAESVATSPP